MDHSDGELQVAGTFDATQKMFSFMLAALVTALKQERIGGYTADGRQVEPPVAHLIRPALQAFVADHWTLDTHSVDMSAADLALLNTAYQQELTVLSGRVVEALRPFEM